jgi:hypothetical protein
MSSTRCEGIFKVARFAFALPLEDGVKGEGNKVLLSELFGIEGSCLLFDSILRMANNDAGFLTVGERSSVECQDQQRLGSHDL